MGLKFEKLGEEEDEAKKDLREAKNLAKKAVDGVIGVATAHGNASANRQTEVEKTGTAAEKVQQGITERWMLTLDFLSDKKKMAKVAGVTVGAALACYLGYQGIKLGSRYVEKHLDQPQLIRESSILSVKQRILNMFKPPVVISRMGEIIVAPMVMEQLEDIAQETRNAKLYNDSLMNVMFYGPPGTGKTMFAKELARNSGLDFAMMSGADFSQFAEGKDVQELHKVFDWAERSKKGLLVFVDEAEVFLAARSLATMTAQARNRFKNGLKWEPSERSKNLTDAFLSRVEKPTSKSIMFVFATNDPAVIDTAVSSRIGRRIKFLLPTQNERERILQLYLHKLTDGAGITVAEDMAQALPRFASQLEGIAPRQLETTVELMVKKARYREDAQIVVSDAQKVVAWKRAEFAEQNAAQAA
jgi:ATPase family AAA domain-containing protein 3A/B